VWSVDVGPVTVPGWWHETGMWSFLPADDLSEQALQWVPAELDVLFIDTNHLYDHTLAELRAYVPRVRPGGTVLCHDTELTRDAGPRTAGCQGPGGVMGEGWVALAAAGPEYPVAAALDAYCAEAGLAWYRQVHRPAPAPPDQPFYGLGTILIPEAAARASA
jgi:Methyltransferase domain